jgi:DNA-directed RNA polymerase specialized sigma24 family protein
MNKVLLKENFQSRKDDLSNDAKEVLSLYLEQALSQQDLVERLSTPRFQVKKKIAKAFLELRKVSDDRDYLKAMEILRNNH